MIRRLGALVLAGLLSVSGCAAKAKEEPRLSLFVGVDISGSFTKTASFKQGIRFLAYYLYAHLNGIGGMEKPRALYVGSIGGDTPNEPQPFYPIHAFERKNIQEMERELLKLFDLRGNYLTDFNAYFKRVSEVVQKQNLVLAPISIVIISDGVPDFAGAKAEKGAKPDYKRIDVSPLEYLARNVTIRLLYPSPTTAVAWEREVPRHRVRIWPVERQVMQGWTQQVANKPNIAEEARLWRWIHDIVDRRAGRKRII